jgi:hypothetical protein
VADDLELMFLVVYWPVQQFGNDMRSTKYRRLLTRGLFRRT